VGRQPLPSVLGPDAHKLPGLAVAISFGREAQVVDPARNLLGNLFHLDEGLPLVFAVDGLAFIIRAGDSTGAKEGRILVQLAVALEVVKEGVAFGMVAGLTRQVVVELGMRVNGDEFLAVAGICGLVVSPASVDSGTIDTVTLRSRFNHEDTIKITV